PFANRLYPESLDVLEHLRKHGTVVLLSDGDVVFQPRKVERSGLFDAVEGHVLIYIHKEEQLEDVAAHYPADHYVLIDDKLRILSAVERLWGGRVTAVFSQTGRFGQGLGGVGGLSASGCELRPHWRFARQGSAGPHRYRS